MMVLVFILSPVILFAVCVMLVGLRNFMQRGK